MGRAIWAALAAFALSLVIGPVIIPWLRRLKLGKEIYELGPQSHKVKQGTPQMGGIIFFVPALIFTLIFINFKLAADITWIPVIAMAGFGMVGFVDDFIKAKKKRAEGLTPRQKMIPQIVISVGLSIWAYLSPRIGSALKIPFTSAVWDLGWLFIPVMTFVLVGTVNSANLMDGLDGLLGGCSAMDFTAMAAVLLFLAAKSDADPALVNCAVFSGAMTGGIFGFLRVNDHPASVFMGDIGAFAIGGALAGVCLVSGTALLLPIIGIMMVISSLSDIIQIGYFKLTHGKRIFRMAPFHHHLELGGMPETKIISLYRLITAAMCLLVLVWFA